MQDKQLVYVVFFLTFMNKHMCFHAMSKELEVSFQPEKLLETSVFSLWYNSLYMTCCFQRCKIPLNTILCYIFIFSICVFVVALNSEPMSRHARVTIYQILFSQASFCGVAALIIHLSLLQNCFLIDWCQS